MSEPSADSLIILDSLRRAVANALEKKRRLGQYAVIWEEGRPAFIMPPNEPSSAPPAQAAEPATREIENSRMPKPAASEP